MIVHIGYAFGGAERTTANLLTHLDRSRIRRITLVAPNILRSYLPNCYDRFIATDSYSLSGGFSTWGALRHDAQWIGKILSEQVPDICLGIMHYSSALLVLGKRLAKVKTRTIASYRGPFYEYMRYYERGLRRRLFLRTVVAATAWLADQVIVPSAGTANELQRRFFTPPHRTLAIPNGIDHAAVAQLASAPADALPDALAAFRNTDRNATSPALICAMARLSPEKNLGLLLEAFRQVRSVQSAVLIILGDGPERASITERIQNWRLQDSIYLLGHCANVYPYVKHADLFIHTCQFEGFGYTLLEALACNTAVISTDCPYGPREILGNNEYGLLTPMNDPEALATAILTLLADPQRRQALAVHGLKRSHELSVARMAEAYTAALVKLAQTPMR